MIEPTTLTGDKLDRSQLESLLKRRLFFTEAFEIYRTSRGASGDNRGLFDYGPPGCALQANIVDSWRKHFVLEENMLELDCTVITPESVFKTSGHVDKFADWMCKDPVKGEYLRADHLVEGVLEARLQASQRSKDASSKDKKSDTKTPKLTEAEVSEYETILAKIDDYDGPELGELITRLDIRNPNGNGKVQDPIPFNLMFKSSIGPSAAAPIYLRPETAQGQFLNFKKLLDYNQGAMPFASASIGKSYRNEISPRSGLLRVREFLMAEIEHFVDPATSKSHKRFHKVADIELPLLSRDVQMDGRTEVTTMSIGKAVSSKVVDNETLGYFLARVQLFLLKLGVDKKKLRFRQHLAKEMAHYATDCWDAELLTTYGWIECVGCADRSAYDLTVHEKFTGVPLKAKEALPKPVEEELWAATLNQKILGPRFKKEAKTVTNAVQELDQEALRKLSQELCDTGVCRVSVSKDQHVELAKDVLTIAQSKVLKTVREYTPNVIEPSFGIGRILYCLLEHTYWHRPGDVARGVLSLPLLVAPTKVLIVPLSKSAEFEPLVEELSARLRALNIANNVDSSSASIGKRYARNDELGTPLSITIDFDTIKNGSITLRERDTTTQVRSSEDDIVDAVKKLVDGSETWEDVCKRLPAFTSQAQDD